MAYSSLNASTTEYIKSSGMPANNEGRCLHTYVGSFGS